MPQAHVTPARAARPSAGRGGHNAGERMTREVLAVDEVRSLMAAFNRGRTGDRNRAAVALMFRAGLRVGEALALHPKHVDRVNNLIRVEDGKGGVDRTVGIDDGALRFVETWMAHRKALGLNGVHPLLCQLNGRPWSRQAFSEALRAAAKKAGIDKRVHPHGLRHSHAVDLHFTEGVPLGAVQKQLGHKSVATTSVYLDHLAPADLVAIARNRPAWA
jgi:site-specific recombinase XerD